MIICLYNLSPIESRVFYELAGAGASTVDDISTKLRRDRSTIHRTLSKLVSTGLCYKETRTLEDGGYYHLYSPVEASKIRDQVSAKVHELCEALQALLENFESDFRKVRRERSI
ncbi:MAG: MarR family transcriptional regulator [Nitrososphaerota archaeon]|nr:MarR family transcriptional regulator [Nitrososphaerota archaeon]